MPDIFQLEPVGFVRSEIKARKDAPRQGYEGAPDSWLDINDAFAPGLQGIRVGEELIVLTWLHLAARDVLLVHPRGKTDRPLRGVFGTRSPDRPNPLGLHRVTVLEIQGSSIRVGPLEVVDRTPVVDIKVVLPRSNDS